MTILTKAMLAQAYDYLCEWPPFSKWNMPPSEDVKFGVIKRKDIYAQFYTLDKIPCIEVSAGRVGAHQILLSTLAHEMLHLHMHTSCPDSGKPHGKAFQKFADRVCKIHGFDRLNF